MTDSNYTYGEHLIMYVTDDSSCSSETNKILNIKYIPIKMIIKIIIGVVDQCDVLQNIQNIKIFSNYIMMKSGRVNNIINT